MTGKVRFVATDDGFVARDSVTGEVLSVVVFVNHWLRLGRRKRLQLLKALVEFVLEGE